MSRLTCNRIKELLAREGKTNQDLAAFMDVRVQTVSSWCTNTNQPTLDTLFKISDFFDMEARDLILSKKDRKEIKTRALKLKRKTPAKKKAAKK